MKKVVLYELHYKKLKKNSKMHFSKVSSLRDYENREKTAKLF